MVSYMIELNGPADPIGQWKALEKIWKIFSYYFSKIIQYLLLRKRVLYIGYFDYEYAQDLDTQSGGHGKTLA